MPPMDLRQFLDHLQLLVRVETISNEGNSGRWRSNRPISHAYSVPVEDMLAQESIDG